MNEWPIAEVARAAGVTSRTLRHYESIGLLHPARVAANGYRFYGEDEIARLYRILALRARICRCRRSPAPSATSGHWRRRCARIWPRSKSAASGWTDESPR